MTMTTMTMGWKRIFIRTRHGYGCGISYIYVYQTGVGFLFPSSSFLPWREIRGRGRLSLALREGVGGGREGKGREGRGCDKY